VAPWRLEISILGFPIRRTGLSERTLAAEVPFVPLVPSVPHIFSGFQRGERLKMLENFEVGRYRFNRSGSLYESEVGRSAGFSFLWKKDRFLQIVDAFCDKIPNTAYSYSGSWRTRMRSYMHTEETMPEFDSFAEGSQDELV
jgi:hypothetical protein